MKRIKLGIRRNLFYPIILFICDFLRKIDSYAISDYYTFKYPILLILIMFVSEFVTGLSLFLYQKNYLTKNKNETEQVFMGIKLITSTQENIPHPDSSLKIFIYIILISLFDFLVFLIDVYIYPKYLDNIQNNENDKFSILNIRLTSILALTSALLYCLIFKSSIYRHQKLSLYIILICTIIILVLEFFIEIFVLKQDIKDFFVVFVLIFINHFLHSTYEIMEKYILEYDFINPFQLLMFEGCFGFVITSIFILFFWMIINKSLKEIIMGNFPEENPIPLIILLLIYFLLCGARNAYKEVTNKIFSPMTLSLCYCILNPIILIIVMIQHFIEESKAPVIIIYYIINFISSFIIVFFCCVYNELIILFCCELECDTHYEIYKRANTDFLLNYMLDEEEHIDE